METTTALSIAAALSKRMNRNLPWAVVRNSIDGAFRAGLFERSVDSGAWPCDFAGAQNVKIRVAAERPRVEVAEGVPVRPGVLWAEAELRPGQLQDLADQVAEIVKIAVGLDLRYTIRLELSASSSPSAAVIERLNHLLAEISKDLRLRG